MLVVVVISRTRPSSPGDGGQTEGDSAELRRAYGAQQPPLRLATGLQVVTA